MTYTYHTHPLRGLYLTYQAVTTVFIRIPLWILLSIPRSLRPRQTWDFKRAVMVKLVHHLMGLHGDVGPLRTVPDHRAITHHAEGSGVWISPVPEDLIVGKLKQWAGYANVESIRIPGYWMHKNGTDMNVCAPPEAGEKVILALHGGGYTRLSAHPGDPVAAIPRGLLAYVAPVRRAFSVEYRLSSGRPFLPAHPFPTALIDALAGYLYLINKVGFSPSDVILEGDSAGGNLAHALTRYLVEYKGTPGLPAPPGCLLLLSPWVDLGVSHDHLGSASTCALSDYLGHPASNAFRHTKDTFLGPHGRDAADINPYISPASLNPALTISFKNFPRTFIVAGGAEVFLDQIRTFRDRVFKDLGEGNGVEEGDGKARYYEAPDGTHDYIVFPWHDPERTDTLKAIAEWIVA